MKDALQLKNLNMLENSSSGIASPTLEFNGNMTAFQIKQDPRIRDIVKSNIVEVQT